MTGRVRWAYATVLAVAFLTFLDTTVVSVMLGSLENDVSAGVIPLQWVVDAYALTFAAAVLAGGSLGDRFGRRRLMVLGLLVFAAGSAMCALAPDVGLVIAGRAVMGLGAAASEPGTLSVIRHLPLRRAANDTGPANEAGPANNTRAANGTGPANNTRPANSTGGLALGYGGWSAAAGLALAAGPVLGGLLVGAGGWRAVFWFGLAAALVLVVLVLVTVPESRNPSTGRVDVPGFVLGAGGIAAVIYGVITAEYVGWTSPEVLVNVVAGGIALVAFVLVERRQSAPLLDVRAVARRPMAAALFGTFAVYFGVFAIFFFTALYLDIGRGYSGARLAGVFAPMAVAVVLGAAGAGRWVASGASRLPAAAGTALAVAGLLLTCGALSGGTPSFWPLAAAMAVAGLGFGTASVPLTAVAMTALPVERSGMAASATNAARQLGSVVGVAALGAVVDSYLLTALDRIFTPRVLEFFGGQSFYRQAVHVLELGGSNGQFDLPQLVGEPVFAAFLREFVRGVQVSLIAAAALILLAGVVAVLGLGGGQTSTTTDSGAAPPMTASTGSA